MSQRLLNTAATHSDGSLLSFFDRACSTAVDSLLAAGSGPVARVAEPAVTSFLQRMKYGQLRIVTSSHVYVFPVTTAKSSVDRHPELSAELVVVRDSFWTRMMTMGDLGFAEAYMVRPSNSCLPCVALTA